MTYVAKLYQACDRVTNARETAEAARATFVANTTVEVNPWVRPLAPLQQAVRALSAN